MLVVKIVNERRVIRRRRCPDFQMTFDPHSGHMNEFGEDKAVVDARSSGVKLPDPER